MKTKENKPTFRPIKRKIQQKIKLKLHKRNPHKGRYDLDLLAQINPALSEFVHLNEYKDKTVDFFNPIAVKELNTALLMQSYKVKYWAIPDGYLCPAIPGRADYIHHLADILAGSNFGKIPCGENIKGLDIGVGASCIYPIIGNHEFGWSFVASEIDREAILSANTIKDENENLKNKIELRLQPNKRKVFEGIIQKNELYDFTLCNPPFHESLAKAQAGTLRKLRNLKKERIIEVSKNFGGKQQELWCEGGEKQFVSEMIFQSKKFEKSCYWFTTMVSQQSHLERLYNVLKNNGVTDYKTVLMGQGNKKSRILAWTFLSKEEQKNWIQKRWKS